MAKDSDKDKGSIGDSFDPNRDRRYQQRLAKLMATAWRDKKFMERLLKDPRPVLEEFEIRLPNDRKIFIHLDSDREVHIVMPAAPPVWGGAIDMGGGDMASKWSSGKCWNLCD
jgi:hypothetical protein